ncbi:hypothetical protein HY468_01925 [Candidatus Roizmanbacteria bacterium]|nr:hypothetical protein [Candidatus Roizmanbacteria bacterium]
MKESGLYFLRCPKTWRAFLRLAVVSTTALALLACDDSTPARSVESETRLENGQSSIDPYLRQYPELATIAPRHLDIGDSTRVYNMTPLEIDGDVLATLASRAAELQEGGVLLSNISYNNQTFDVKFVPLSAVQKTVVLRDLQAPRPSWNESTHETLIQFDDQGIPSATSLVTYEGDRSNVSWGMATEICQQTLRSAVRGTTQDVGLLELVGQNGKEAVCNSFGMAYQAKVEGKSYADYLQMTAGRGIPTSIGDLPVLQFPENFYNSLPPSFIR